jgi:hypothetical protein
MNVPRRIYVESDPFAVQVKVAQGDHPLWMLWLHMIPISASEKTLVLPTAIFPWRVWTGSPRASRSFSTCGIILMPVTRFGFQHHHQWHNKGKNIE